MNNINTFIFVGDYCLSNPYQDECISVLRFVEKYALEIGDGQRAFLK